MAEALLNPYPPLMWSGVSGAPFPICVPELGNRILAGKNAAGVLLVG